MMSDLGQDVHDIKPVEKYGFRKHELGSDVTRRPQKSKNIHSEFSSPAHFAGWVNILAG